MKTASEFITEQGISPYASASRPEIEWLMKAYAAEAVLEAAQACEDAAENVDSSHWRTACHHCAGTIRAALAAAREEGRK